MVNKRLQKSKCVFSKHLPHLEHDRLSETHIWPDWLNRMVPPDQLGHFLTVVHHDQTAPRKAVRSSESKTWRTQPLFSKRPNLACMKCNNGWMNDIEQKCLAFVRPIVTSHEKIVISYGQAKQLSAWLCLLTIASEYMTDEIVVKVISSKDIRFLHRNRRAPESWTIVIRSQNGVSYPISYWRHSLYIQNPIINSENYDIDRGLNSLLVTFGIGKLLVQVFTCPNEHQIIQYEIFAKSRNFVQLWPRPEPIFPILSQKIKFPLTPIMPDLEIRTFHYAFANLVRVLANSRKYDL